MRKKPPLELQTTTLWYYPSQQYGGEPKGDPRFPGRTPAWVVWNLLTRYTRAGDLVVDPFCGGGTTLDVAQELERRALGFDVEPARPDIQRADARKLPLDDGVADFVFMDPPYSTHIEYSQSPDCIGKLDAFGPEYYRAMDDAFGEARRVLKDQRYLAVYCSDSFKKGRGFAPIGAGLFALLVQRFVPVDHIVVVRGNRKLERPRFHAEAERGNFFLRGFNHLLLFKKERQQT